MTSRSFLPFACALLTLAPVAVLADTPAAIAPVATLAAKKPVNNVQGKITSVDTAAKTITVTSRRGAVTSTFGWDDATQVFKTSADVLTDLKVGDVVRINGDAITPASPTLTAKRIMVVPALEATKHKINAKSGFHRNGVDGVVAATSPALTVTTPGGVTVTVNATPETRIDKETVATTGDLFAGVTVQARLKKDAPSPLAATITIVTPRR